MGPVQLVVLDPTQARFRYLSSAPIKWGRQGDPYVTKAS